MTSESALSYLPCENQDKVLIHVGLHKTGTTWLQQRIFKALDGRFIDFCGDLDLIYRELIVPEIVDFSTDRVRMAFAGLMQTAKAAKRLPVISGEALAGRPFHAKFHRAVVAQRIAETFPNAHILFTIREQTSIIRSMYGQYIRFGYSSSIHQFLQQPPDGSSFAPILNMDFYDYEKMIEEYRQVFAPERIVVMPFERLIADPAWAMDLLERNTGFPIPKTLPEANLEKASNPAWSALAYGAVRNLNRFVSQDARWQDRRYRFNTNAIGYWVDRITPRVLRRRMDEHLTQTVRDKIGDYYKLSNRNASKLIGVDLSEFGYAV